MTFSWQKMTGENYAAFVQLTGGKVIRTGDMYWRQVRAGFYRPLLQFEEYHPDSIKAPRPALWGGVQYAVAPEARANSFLNRLAFANTQGYGLDSLQRNWKRKVRLAGKELVIRPIADVNEFKQKAFPVYLSFYERTRYQVGAQRRDPAHFSRWADALFSLPHVLILGGYRDAGLGGVSLSFVVGHTLIYATFFCNDESLGSYLPDRCCTPCANQPRPIRRSRKYSPACTKAAVGWMISTCIAVPDLSGSAPGCR